MTPTFVLYAALINWIATTILVESTLFAPVREWFIAKTQYVRTPDGELHRGGYSVKVSDFPDLDAARAWAMQIEPVIAGPWVKAAQLVTCIMCLGTWVGFAEALVFGGPFIGWYAVIANGLLFKAGGHFIYEARSRIAKVDPPADSANIEVHDAADPA